MVREKLEKAESFESRYETNELLYNCTSVFLAQKKGGPHASSIHMGIFTHLSFSLLVFEPVADLG